MTENLVVCAMMLLASKKMQKKVKTKRLWQKKWLANRNEFSDMKLLKELKTNSPTDLYNYLRMDAHDFGNLLEEIRPYIQKDDTNMRKSIPPEERLVATLRFLATGRSYECLKFSAGISPQALGQIIPEVCVSIYKVLRKKYMKFPASTQEWTEIAKQFEKKWQMPNCGGAMDGKHIRITAPPKSGALYYNYKNFYSIILMALVNANHEFIYIDVGKNGRISDGGFFEYTTLYEKITNGTIHFPTNEENLEKLNFVLIGDEAFSLHSNMLKPFSKANLNYKRRIFNYRLSRARNVVENTFGLISTKFRILHTSINVKIENTKHIICAICVLHNYLMQSKSKYVSKKTFDSENPITHEVHQNGAWRTDDPYSFTSLQTTSRAGSGSNFDCVTSREKYSEYFNNNGKVPWQDNMLKYGKS